MTVLTTVDANGSTFTPGRTASTDSSASLDGLAMLIRQRQGDRQQRADALIASIEAKYCKKGGKVCGPFYCIRSPDTTEVNQAKKEAEAEDVEDEDEEIAPPVARTSSSRKTKR